ncbi:hypothetical protein ACEQ8H_007234 [Pleosporales sp. CAS-2024a]
MTPSVPKNNAFGDGSPSWNLLFPNGNLTAAEILAYLPHWLKTVDVIDRFVANGGTSNPIAAIITEFRYLPGDGVFNGNSAQIMMSYNMRRSGFEKWKVGQHLTFERCNPDMLETDLNVGTFRTQAETHPKSAKIVPGSAQDLRVNKLAEPIDFKSLALHVKKHPTGDDALDLSRCVAYALAHPKETWYFPDDFEVLVDRLGGPAVITHSHLDRQIFARRDKRPSVLSPTNSARKRKSESNTPPATKPTESIAIMPQSRRIKGLPNAPATGSPLKLMMDADGAVEIGGQRKSGRLAKKPSINFRDRGSDGEDDVDSTRSGYSTPAKKRKLTHVPPTPASPSNDSDFQDDGSEPEEEALDVDEASEDELMYPASHTGGRAAARKARQVIRDISMDVQRNIDMLSKQKRKESMSPRRFNKVSTPPVRAHVQISPEMMDLARQYPSRTPTFVEPPVLPRDRLRVDSSSIWLYSAPGCATTEDMWASALSSTRFHGPRRHPPFRELHRLTDPPAHDISDYAENIRWAKEQYAVFGSETWTEEDYHLKTITAHRKTDFWASEELILSGM